MGKVYLGDQFISDVYTHMKEIPVEKYVDVLKKPASRYIVDEDGVVKCIEFDFTGGFNEITSIGSYGLYYAFYNCTGITGSIDFPNLNSVDNQGLYYAFYGCKGINSVSFPKLTSIGYSGLNRAFRDCKGINSVSFPKLTSIDTQGLYYAFYGCTGITGSINFPKLTSIDTQGLYYAFYGCTGITELHFRADTQSVIEAQLGYSDKFGATNATIYFDL